VIVFDYARLENEEKELTVQSENPELWKDQEKTNRVMKQLTFVRDRLESFRRIEKNTEELILLAEMALEENDAQTFNECLKESDTLRSTIEKTILEASFKEKHDALNAIISIHPGAGGTESCDFASMLYRMYTRWADASGYTWKELDRLPGEEAGIKSITFSVEGPYAYGKLSSEKGVHRLVRISPFDSNARRHTSFASVEVMPEADDDVEVVINETDLKIDTYRSSGAGGQHVNVTDSAVRITHLPTGLVVTCQNERSQLKNRSSAMKILRARLYERMLVEHENELNKIRGEKKEIAWGSQIRSYVLQPYTLVKDLRTSAEVGNAQGVLDGDLDPFIDAFVKWNVSRNKK